MMATRSWKRNILGDPAALRGIREGEAELNRGDFVSLDAVTECLRDIGRLPR